MSRLRKVLFAITFFSAALTLTCDGPQYTVESNETTSKVEGVGGIAIALAPGNATNVAGLYEGRNVDDFLIGTFMEGTPKGFISVGNSESSTGQFAIGEADNDNPATAVFESRFELNANGSITLRSRQNSAAIHLEANDITLQGVGRNAAGRAFVAENGDQLIVNYSNDFTGGTQVNGTLYANVASPSDSSLKTNVLNLDRALERVLQLRGVSFDWNDVAKSKGQMTGRDIGLIAQEVERVIPEVVTIDANNIRNVCYDKLVPLLIEAIKEQQTTIDDLRNRLDEVDSRSKGQL